MTPEQMLTQILSEPIESVKAREASTFTTAQQYSKLVLYGAGGLGKKVLHGLKKIGQLPLAFVDQNPALWGRVHDNIPILSPEDAAKKFGDNATFILCTWKLGSGNHVALREWLQSIGCQSVISFIPLFWKYPELFLPHWRLDLPHKIWQQKEDVWNVFNLLGDEASKREYIRQIEWMISPELIALPVESPASDLCFPKGLFATTNEEVFIDCGAYDGDTLRTFIEVTASHFAYAYCFEPDPLNFKRLQQYVGSLPPDVSSRIFLLPAAVGAEKTTLRMSPTGTESSIINVAGSAEIPCVRLDDVLEHKPTYIQMDIEGFEPDALKGAETTIRACMPRLGIRLYHEQHHLWSIPLQIQSYSDKYRLFIRRHGDEFGDTVCYALPRV